MDIRLPQPAARAGAWSWVSPFVVRLPVVALMAAWYGLRLLLRLGRRRLTGAGPSPSRIIGSEVADLLRSLGGGFPKLGQILSTRVDLLGEDVLAPLRQLQDNVTPLPERCVRRRVELALGVPVEELFEDFEPLPLASASIGQVHRATLRGTREKVAVKVRRPGIDRAVAADVRLLRCGAWLLSLLPPLRGVPVRESAAQVGAALVAQTDFRREAAALRRYREQRCKPGEVLVPDVIDRLCAADVLTMQYVETRGKITDAGIDLQTRRTAVRRALRAIYESIFLDGFFHCDPHPGNLLVAPDGAVVVLDLGYVAEFTPAARRVFAEFFLAIGLRDGSKAAAIVRATARHVPRDVDFAQFESDVAALVQSCSGLLVAQFQIVRFVTRLFGVQHAHGICGSDAFTLAILALLGFEGTLKAIDPRLDFQREAVPVLLAALAR
jgi:ubiquinone biosynthesis protein